MNLSKNVEYSLQILLLLNGKTKPVRTASLAAAIGVGVCFPQQLVVFLRNKGLVNCIKGPNGGIVLGKSLIDITVGDVMDAVKEKSKKTVIVRENYPKEVLKVITYLNQQTGRLRATTLNEIGAYYEA